MTLKIKYLAALPLALSLLSGTAMAQSLTETWKTDGFAVPESAYFEASTGQIIVSNIGAFSPDGGEDGVLSLISADGAMIERNWITGLVDPKGMVAVDGTLYVADVPGVHVIDVASGTHSQTIAVEGAMLLNDVTADGDGNIYVTDMMQGAILRLAGETAEWLVAPGGVSLPNGILWDNGQLVVGSFGAGMGENFSVEAKGGLLTVDPATGAVTPVPGTEETAQVDGIARIGDWLLYNDNPTGEVFGVGADGSVLSFGVTVPGAGDQGTDGTQLLVPSLNSGDVTAYVIE